MKILNKGHIYSLEVYDKQENETQIVYFMQRVGTKYPGNIAAFAGTNLQEVIRMCIDRFKYLDNQVHSIYNSICIWLLRFVILFLEKRAAKRHRLKLKVKVKNIEHLPTCKICGHIICGDNFL